MASVIRRNAASGKSSLTVAATNIGDGSKAPDPLNIRLNGRLLHSSRARQWKRPSPAPGAGLRMFFVGGSDPAHSAPPGNPSAQPFSPPPRSTDGARTDQSGTNLAQPAASKPSTNTRPTEMPMKQREPGALLARFRAPGAGLPYDGPSSQRRSNNGPPEHPQTPEGDDS